jgi:integrase
MGFTYKILLRKDYKSKRDSQSDIRCRITIDREVHYLSMNISTKFENWSENNCRVKAADPEAYLKNLVIKDWQEKLSTLYFEYRKADKIKNLSLDLFKKDFLNKKSESPSFYNFIKEEIELLKPLRSVGTINNYRKLLAKLQEFRLETHFQDLTLTYIETFHQYLCNYKKVDKKSSLDESYIYKLHKDLRMFINRALDKKLMNDYPYSKFVVKEKFKKEITPLSIEEVEKLFTKYKSNEYKTGKRKVLRNFLVACYSGLSFSDFIDLRYNDIKTIDIKGERYQYIKGNRQKTKEEYVIPVVNYKLIELIGNGLSEQRIFQTLENQPTNRYLKAILSDNKISKHLSFHDARHNFRTIADRKGIRPSIIKKIMGHADGDISDMYNHTSIEDVILEVRTKWNI